MKRTSATSVASAHKVPTVTLRKSGRIKPISGREAKINDAVGGDPERPRYSFDAIFSPRSVAIIGASERPGSVGRAIVENLRFFKGATYLINPFQREVLGTDRSEENTSELQY